MQEAVVLLNPGESKSSVGYKVGDMFLLQSGFLGYKTPNLKFLSGTGQEESRNRTAVSSKNESISAVYIDKQYLNKVLYGYFDSEVEQLFNAVNSKEISFSDPATKLRIIEAFIHSFGKESLIGWINSQKNAALNGTNLEYLIRLVNGFIKYDSSSLKKEMWVTMVRYNENVTMANSRVVESDLNKLKNLLVDNGIKSVGDLMKHLIADRGLDEGLIDALYISKTIFGLKHSVVDMS
jgi:hypothetical protein